MNRSESIKEIAVALCKFQSEVSNPKNTAVNPMYKSKYAPLDVIINTVKPVLTKHGLTFIQSTSTTDDGEHMTVTTLLMHESGEWIESDPVILPAYKLGKGGSRVYDAQAAGIAITYGRRYSLSAMLGISSQDDDDANGIAHDEGQNTPEEAKGKPISSKQVGFIKINVKKLGKLRGKTDEEVYEKLGFSDVTQLTQTQASKAIETLNKWLEQAESNQSA